MYRLKLNAASQAELYLQARDRMAQLLPGWSDTSLSDPAVALLELFSYLSEVQNRRIDTLQDECYLAFLRLLSLPPRQLACARLLAEADGPLLPWPGMRFLVDGVPFEAVNVPSPECRRTVQAALVRGGTPCFLREDVPLSPAPETPLKLEITLDAPLPAKTPVSLWLELQPEAGRVPPEEATPPPVRLFAQIRARDAWLDVPCCDGTCGLLKSGFISLMPPAAFDTLRLRTDEPLEGEPRISAAALQPVMLEQRHTRSRCLDLTPPYPLPPDWEGNWVLRFFVPLGEGWREDKTLFARDGFVQGIAGQAPPLLRVAAAEADFQALYSLEELPGEEIFLEEDGILPSSIQLMIEEDSLWYDCPVRSPEPERTLARGCRWNGAHQSLCFGDGRDFQIPQGGQLLIVGCASTLGAAGNGAGGRLERDGISLRPLGSARDGQDAEDGRTAFFQAAGEQAPPKRAVSLADYETLALHTPGLALDRVRALAAGQLGRPGAGVVVIAKPRSASPLPQLTQWQTGQLSAWLEHFRMIGVPVEVRGPVYCPIEVRLRVRFSEPGAEPALREAVFRHTDGISGPVDFGAELSRTALFSALSAVPGVETVCALALYALSGGGRRTREGGIQLNADTLPHLDRLQLTQEQEAY